MYINGGTGINFGANFVSNTNIKKYESNTDSYKDVPASFVELDPHDKNDVKSVNEAVFYWNNDLYGINIANSITQINEEKLFEDYDKFFAITTQDKNFWKLNPDKVQAVVQVSECKNQAVIRYLQVKPGDFFNMNRPIYKNVGKGTLNALKQKYNDRDICLISSKSAKKFYEKEGFVNYGELDNLYIYKKKK